MFHTNQANNPTIEELQQEDDFVLIENIAHSEIKTFVIDQLTTESKIIKSYMIYQVLMVLIGIFFITRSLVLAFKGVFQPLIFTFTGLAFSLTFLILIHELLHGLALKFTGAPRISFGGYIKKFIFYAEADCHVLNRCQYVFVALTPLITVKIATLITLLISLNHSLFYFPLIVMSAHTLFCAGDIGLLSFFFRFPNSNIYTYDSKAEKRSYFYKKIVKE